jgi:molecular chaperone GrpE
VVEQNPEEILKKENAAEAPELDTVEGLRKALAEEKAKAEANLARWQRAQADFINFKRCSEQEKMDLGRWANTNLLLGILPVIDDFERALGTIPEEAANQNWAEGIKLIERKLRSALEKQGLSAITALGEQFDPQFHEAVMCSKGKENIVIQELQKGYKLNDRTIRPSKVVVGNGEEPEEEEMEHV